MGTFIEKNLCGEVFKLWWYKMLPSNSYNKISFPNTPQLSLLGSRSDEIYMKSFYKSFFWKEYSHETLSVFNDERHCGLFLGHRSACSEMVLQSKTTQLIKARIKVITYVTHRTFWQFWSTHFFINMMLMKFDSDNYPRKYLKNT